MKTLLLSIIGSLFAVLAASGQGAFEFWNGTVPTRIGSLQGPLAGPGIWGQCLAGPATDALAPVGVPVDHQPSGVVFGGDVAVPGVSGTWAFVQMVAWDGRVWGADLSAVPTNQLGRTDVVGVSLNAPPAPRQPPPWTQPAIVPIPEPSVLGLTLLGAGVVLLVPRPWFGRRPSPQPAPRRFGVGTD